MSNEAVVEGIEVVEEVDNVEFAGWLEGQFLQWQITEGGRRTLGQFAEKLDISQGLLSHYLKGIRKPRLSTVVKMAEVVGNEIYTVLGMTMPDPVIMEINEKLNSYTSDERNKALDFMRSM